MRTCIFALVIISCDAAFEHVAQLRGTTETRDLDEEPAFVFSSNAFCRFNATISDLGDQANDYYDVVSVNGLQDCQRQCAERDDCTGFEHASYRGRCSLWKKPIGYVEPTKPGYDCYIKQVKQDSGGGEPLPSTNIPTFAGFEGFANSGCRGPFSGTFGSYYLYAPNQDVDYRYMHPGESTDMCKFHCERMEGCTGFEHYELEGYGQCWLWRISFSLAQNIAGHNCYRRL